MLYIYVVHFLKNFQELRPEPLAHKIRSPNCLLLSISHFLQLIILLRIPERIHFHIDENTVMSDTGATNIRGQRCAPLRPLICGPAPTPAPPGMASDDLFLGDHMHTEGRDRSSPKSSTKHHCFLRGHRKHLYVQHKGDVWRLSLPWE